MIRRVLERPCTLAMLIGFQLAFMMYFSFGGLRSLASIFGRSQEPTFDYSRTHDVYTNLSRIQATHRPGTMEGGMLPWCPEKSPYLGTFSPTCFALRRLQILGCVCAPFQYNLQIITVQSAR